MTVAQARKIFSRWRKKVGGYEAASKLLRCSRAAVWYIEKGERNAGFRLAPRIQSEVGIPALVWHPDGGI